MSDICAARFEAFGSAGNADKIKVSSLDTMHPLTPYANQYQY
jgi:fructose-bisphosphate aldolase class II